MTERQKAYARAGVDVDLGNRLKRRIQSLVRKTHGAEVLGKIGGFGGLFAPNLRGMRKPVLVASVDGVGTKLKIAFAANKHHTVGADLVITASTTSPSSVPGRFFFSIISERKS